MEHEDVLGGLSLPARFESVRLLGRGGMGAVFLASDRFLSRQVAIKVLAPELASDPVARERFAREAALAGRLGSHRHIVTAHEAGEWDGRPYVVFEYMPNGSLAERLRDHGAPPRSQALRWLGQAAEALDYAHAAKVVHRDVKPSNLLLDAQEDICIADFGVSRRDGETTLTGEGEIVGTEGYLAPEQVAGRGATTASDRFALAVVAQQLLTGELPAAHPAGLGAEVDAVFEQALADQPDRRYPTASSFVDALQTALVADPAPILPTPTRRRLLPPRTTPGLRRVPAPSRVFSRHRQRTPAWRVAAFLVAALVVAAPATAGGLALGRRLAREHTPQAQHRAPVSRCAVSQFGADANLVVVGVGATRFCRLQAETLSAQGAAWSYRTGTRLQAPDSGDPYSLARVCTLSRGRLTAAVYDDLGQAIGHDLCQTYAAAGWALRSYS